MKEDIIDRNTDLIMRKRVATMKKGLLCLTLLMGIFVCPPVRADVMVSDQEIQSMKSLQAEIAVLRDRLDQQCRSDAAALSNDYAGRRSLLGLPQIPEPAPKDLFESTAEYFRRLDEYKRKRQEVDAAGGEALQKLRQEETLRLAEAKVACLERQISVLEPLVARLEGLQARRYTLAAGGKMEVVLGAPDADRNRFPLNLQYQGQSWSVWWSYEDRDRAKEFYRTRTQLQGDGIFQIEEKGELLLKITGARVSHPVLKEVRDFSLDKPAAGKEIGWLAKLRQEEAVAREELKKAIFVSNHREIGNDGRFIAYDDGTVLDKNTNLMWAARDNGRAINWQDARSYCEGYRGGGYTDWRMPTRDELGGLYDRNRKENIYGARLTALIKVTDAWVWAADASGAAAGINIFYLGDRFWFSRSLDDNDRALPVRSVK